MPGLDAVRFAAAALVMAFHLGTATWAAKGSLSTAIVGGRAAFPELLGFTSSGYVGVEIFFVISGIVIANSAAHASAAGFLRGRLARLYPAAWICATITLAALWPLHVEDPALLLRGYAHAMSLAPAAPWVDSVYWTLGIEMSFYACIFALLACGAFGRLEAFALVLGSASAAYWIFGVIVSPTLLAINLWNRGLELSLLSYGIYFALGLTFYAAAHGRGSPGRTAFTALLLIAAAIEIEFKAATTALALHIAPNPILPAALFYAAVVAMVFSLRWEADGLAARVLRVAGLATYPLYLLHDNLGAVLVRLARDAGLSRFPALALAAAACIGASVVVATLLEPPLQRAVRAHFDRGARLLRLGAPRRASQHEGEQPEGEPREGCQQRVGGQMV